MILAAQYLKLNQVWRRVVQVALGGIFCKAPDINGFLFALWQLSDEWGR